MSRFSILDCPLGSLKRFVIGITIVRKPRWSY